MNREQAKEILALFRPGTADEQDPSFAEARLLVKTDPELAGWFNEHCAAYLALRRIFQEIPIPPGLKEQILSERKIHRPFFARYGSLLLAAAAVVVLLIGIQSGFWSSGGPANDHSAYVKSMTEIALVDYDMSLFTNDPVKIRDFLAQNHAPADYSLPAGLSDAQAAGCFVSTWQDRPVSMICFKTGRPLGPRAKSDLWLFVADRATVAKAPRPGRPPVFERVDKAVTASWSDQSNTYLLAAVGDEALLKKYLP